MTNKAILLVLSFLLLAVDALHADHPCSTPLVLDMNGDGRISTTGLSNSVLFDIDGDGELDQIGWLHGKRDAFLWLDINGNRTVDDGRELFGNSTLLPDGTPAAHGFAALAVWDTPELGGDGDGVLTHKDAVWHRLRLWIDANHDAVSQRPEISTLPAEGVRAIGLDFERLDRTSGNGNLHLLGGQFVKRVEILGQEFERFEVIEDILFVVRSEDDHPLF